MIIVESGGTKSTWVFRDSNNELHKTVLDGLHPQEVTSEKINSVQEFIEEARLQGSAVYFFGAGCESQSGNKVINTFLVSLGLNPKMIVSDVVGACMAVLGLKPGVAGILGTGAVAAQYDGEKVEKMASGRGYILGDEGSGFDIGKRITVACLDGELTDYPEVESIIHDYYGGKHKIVHACSGPSSRFKIAGLTKVISDYRENPIIHSIISQCFQEFVEQGVNPLDHPSEIGMVGSVAFHFQHELAKVLKDNGISLGKVVSEASEGIFLFVEDKF